MSGRAQPRHAHGRTLAAALLLAVSTPLPSAAAQPGDEPVPPLPLPEVTAVDAEPEEPLRVVLVLAEPAPAGVPKSFMDVPDGGWLDWLDLPHAFLTRQVFGVVNGFDRFFADERDLGTARSHSFIRLRGETRVTEDGKLDFGSSVRADLRFPYVQKRL
ncbi:MAG TPA: hypothetical protein VLT61_11485, partial [Anaeromyxobacteraceae bacterium]|nr:hypothetical protein [Anaeromyxobacteraceae bacterium]